MKDRISRALIKFVKLFYRHLYNHDVEVVVQNNPRDSIEFDTIVNYEPMIARLYQSRFDIYTAKPANYDPNKPIIGVRD